MSRWIAAALGALGVLVIAALAWPEAAYERFEPDAAYRAQAERYSLPPMPADWTQQTWTAEDGTVLRWGETGNRDSAKATVVWVPGYTATLDMYGEQIDLLAERGYHVIGVDLRGQGMSQRDRADQPEKLLVDDFGVYTADLAAFVTEVAPQGRPVIPMAMSFGGHVAYRTAFENPGLFDAIFLVAPALQPRMGENSAQAVTAMKAMKGFGRGERYVPGQGNWTVTMPDLRVAGPEYCASNPARLHARDVVFTRNPEQRVGGVTANWGLAFMESAESLAARDVSGLSVPVRMMLAEYEVFVENDANLAACDRLPQCETLLIEGTAHCLMQESDAVLATMFDELDALTASLGAPGEG